MKKLLRWGKALALLLLAAAILAAGVIVYRGYRMYRDAITAVPLADRSAQVQAVPNYTTLDELPEIEKMQFGKQELPQQEEETES